MFNQNDCTSWLGNNIHSIVQGCKRFDGVKAKKMDDLLAKYSFAVPVFHAYGHTAEC